MPIRRTRRTTGMVRASSTRLCPRDPDRRFARDELWVPVKDDSPIGRGGSWDESNAASWRAQLNREPAAGASSRRQDLVRAAVTPGRPYEWAMASWRAPG